MASLINAVGDKKEVKDVPTWEVDHHIPME